MGKIAEDIVEVEGKIVHRTAKALLFEPTIGEKCWLPLSQVYKEHEPDMEGNVVLHISDWIARKNGLS